MAKFSHKDIDERIRAAMRGGEGKQGALQRIMEMAKSRILPRRPTGEKPVQRQIGL